MCDHKGDARLFFVPLSYVRYVRAKTFPYSHLFTATPGSVIYTYIYIYKRVNTRLLHSRITARRSSSAQLVALILIGRDLRGN